MPASPPTHVCTSRTALRLTQREPTPPGLPLAPGERLACSHMASSACSEMGESRGGKEIYGNPEI